MRHATIMKEERERCGSEDLRCRDAWKGVERAIVEMGKRVKSI